MKQFEVGQVVWAVNYADIVKGHVRAVEGFVSDTVDLRRVLVDNDPSPYSIAFVHETLKDALADALEYLESLEIEDLAQPGLEAQIRTLKKLLGDA